MQANERNSCQHCWRSSKEAIHSGTVILADVFHQGQHCCGSMRYASPGHRTMEMLGLVAKKSLTGLKLYAKSANNYQQSPTLLSVPTQMDVTYSSMLDPTMLRVVGQRCCTVCMVLNTGATPRVKKTKWTDTDAKKLAFCAFLQKWGKTALQNPVTVATVYKLTH